MNHICYTLLFACLFCPLASSAQKAAAIKPLPRPGYLDASKDYREFLVNGTPVDVTYGEGGESNAITYDFVRFTMDGPAEIKIRTRKAMGSVKAMPSAYDISPSAAGSTITFTLDQPRGFILHAKGLRKLVVLADPTPKAIGATDRLDVMNALDIAGIDATGQTLNTQQIQDAIDRLPTGGTLHFPEGEYLFTQIKLKSDMTLHLAAGAVLKASTNPDDYEWLKLSDRETRIGWGHVQAWDAQRLKITGQGIIDGRQSRYAKEKSDFRQALIQLIRCSDVDINDITVMNAGFWSVTPRYSHDIRISRLKVLSIDRWLWADGIDPVSSRNVTIDDCFVLSGDDAASPKGRGNLQSVIGSRPEPALENVHYSRCVFHSGNANGIRVGSEAQDDIRNVTFTDCHVIGARSRGILVWGARGEGTIENIRFENLTIDGIGSNAIDISTRKDKAGQIAKIDGVDLNNVSILQPEVGFRIATDPAGEPIRNIRITDLSVAGQPIGSMRQLEDSLAGKIELTRAPELSFQLNSKPR